MPVFYREPCMLRLEDERGELRSSLKCGENGVTLLCLLTELRYIRREEDELAPRPVLVSAIVDTRDCLLYTSDAADE